MNVKNTWAIIKNRYRLSTKIQMNFELSFPDYLIGKCRFTANNTHEIRTKKVSPSIKGIIFSDTIPLSWFTCSALIPWEKVLKIDICDNSSVIDGIINAPLSFKSKTHALDSGYRTIELNDPQEITIDLPWSKEFTDYVQRNKLLDI